jgi:opacity protein-like surface antigen
LRRLLMVCALAALMAAMMVASAAPVMANNLFDDNGNFVGGGFNNNNNLFDDNGNFVGDGDCGIFCNDGRFANSFDDNNRNDNNLDTIRVGDLECLVEDGDDVDFCVNRHTGEIVNV